LAATTSRRAGFESPRDSFETWTRAAILRGVAVIWSAVGSVVVMAAPSDVHAAVASPVIRGTIRL
jgi:hypothetical protein